MSKLRAVAKAIYESYGFVKPWDHPDTVRNWHQSCLRAASFAIRAMDKYRPKRMTDRETREWVRDHIG